MRILVAHNLYQRPGGEDICFDLESDLLRSKHHDLTTYTVHNDAIAHMNDIRKASVAIWNHGSFNELSRLISEAKPDIVHFHNIFPLMSPAVFWAAKKQGCAVVNTLHNYRLMCPAGTLLRDGQVCEECVGQGFAWPAVRHGCYRDSRLASAAVGATHFAHRVLGTWRDKVDVFIALSQFARRKYIDSGIPEERILLKPNFVAPDPGPGEARGSYALFVGRLSPEKGVDTLLAAWNKLADKTTLRMVGEGPLTPNVEAAASTSSAIEHLGRKDRRDVMDLMSGADFLVMPSLSYETFGLTIIEAFANATPVIVSRRGAMTELVEDGRTGLHFQPGDPDDLAAKITWAIAHPEEMRSMGRNARAVYARDYTAEANYHQLLRVYEAAMTSARAAHN